MRLRKRELVELRILDSEEELHGGHGLLVSNNKWVHHKNNVMPNSRASFTFHIVWPQTTLHNVYNFILRNVHNCGGIWNYICNSDCQLCCFIMRHNFYHSTFY